MNKKFNILVFILLTVSIFVLYRQLFNFSFEADEWNVTAHYLPLVKMSLLNGLTASVLSPIMYNDSAGQHNVPIASIIYYLNTRFFGIQYPPYAFMSLLLHAANSFLVFLLIKVLLLKKGNSMRNTFGVLGAIFFAFAPTPMHTITGAAPFYGQNLLSVTFFLLCLISFKMAFIKKDKKFIYITVLFLFSSLFMKETSFFLFLLLPTLAILEKRIFSFKFLSRIFIASLIIYALFRFLIPNFYLLQSKLSDIIANRYIPTSSERQADVVDTGTIVSRDLSIYKNLPEEVLLRTITFPLRMAGTLFLPRQTAFSIVQFITPAMVPIMAISDSSAGPNFLYGSGNFVVIYLVGLLVIIFCIKSIIACIRKNDSEEARALVAGLAIILLSALPLVAIIFSFPRWGFDFYFDSRFYYNPNVGAAIIFPFLIFAVSKLISTVFNQKSVIAITSIVFLIWLINNMYVFGLTRDQFINRFGSDRREIISQIETYMPVLSRKTVFYFETDGKSAFGPVLPFFTSPPQALTLAYYDKSPLPDSFFNKPLFDGKAQGYDYAQNRGFGYFYSKKELSSALLSGEFEVNDIHAFYFDSVNAKLSNITSKIRTEMEQYKKEAKSASMWKISIDSSTSLRFKYASDTKIDELQSADPTIVKILKFKNSALSGEMVIMKVPPEFNLDENINFLLRTADSSANPKNVHGVELFFDKYNSNKVQEIDGDLPRYFIRINDILIHIKTEGVTAGGSRAIESIIGSLEIINEK